MREERRLSWLRLSDGLPVPGTTGRRSAECLLDEQHELQSPSSSSSAALEPTEKTPIIARAVW